MDLIPCVPPVKSRQFTKIWYMISPNANVATAKYIPRSRIVGRLSSKLKAAEINPPQSRHSKIGQPKRVERMDAPYAPMP